MKYGLSDQQRKEITDILTSYKAVEKAILFGSRAIDTYKEASDVDIAIKGQNADWSLAMTIQDHLEEETYLPFFFDVVAYGSVESEELRRHIDGKGRVLFCRGMSEGLMENGELSVENGGSAWQEVRLGGCIRTNIQSIGKDYPFDEILYLDTGSITENRIEKLQRFNIKEAPSRAKRIVENDDIIYSSVRPNQLHYGFIKDPEENLVVSTGFVVISCNREDIRPKYLFYYLSSATSTEYLHSIAEASTSAYPSLKPSDIEALDIELPPLPEQKAIADVLSALDDKIDLLYRQNKTLEQMAETLFRQWFVVEAGEDWVEYKVSDIVNHIKENVKPGSNPLLTYRHYSLPAFDNEKNPVIEVGKDILSNKYVVLPQTILVSKLNPKVPRIWAIPDKVAENSVCSTEFQVFQPKKELYYGFLCFLFKSNEAVGELEMAASGTSGSHQRVKSQDILNIMFSVPSLDKIEKYSQEVKPLIEKQQRNNDYICTLQSLRDTLLPKLMSGEVRIASNG